MRKHQELTDPLSCLNKARDNELLFVLLERDPAAPHTIREWVKKRIEIGKNKPEDPQVKEAWALAQQIEESQKV